MTTKSKKTASKTVDPMEAIQQAEAKINTARISKLDALVKAKEVHDTAVKKAAEDEFATYRELLTEFRKRVPFLNSIVVQLAKLKVKMPTITLHLHNDVTFGAHQYTRYVHCSSQTVYGIGTTYKGASTYYTMLNPEGNPVTYKEQLGSYASSEEIKMNPPVNDCYRSNPTVKEFMIAALDWEKQLLAIVDSL